MEIGKQSAGITAGDGAEELEKVSAGIKTGNSAKEIGKKNPEITTVVSAKKNEEINPEAEDQQGMIMVTSGGFRAPQFDGALNVNMAKLFLQKYDAYVDAATMDRQNGDEREVAGLMDLIPQSRQRSLLRTRSTGCRVTEEACRQAVERVADLSLDGDDEPRDVDSVVITQDELNALRMNDEPRASDRVEGVAEALERFLTEGGKKHLLLNETRQWKHRAGQTVVKAMIGGVWPGFLYEQIMADIGFNDAANANPDAVLDIMRKHAKAFYVVEEYEDWILRGGVVGKTSAATGKGHQESKKLNGCRHLANEERQMQIYIMDFSGRHHTFEAFPSDTVARVKKLVRQEMGVPPVQQRLLFGGKQMEDDKTLSEYRVQNLSTLHCAMRLRGGKPVILLYPPSPLDASVHLSLNFGWKFSALYPAPSREKALRNEECKWTVRANPDGTLKDMETRKKYPYLFWEADSDDGRVVRSFDLDGTPSFCVPGNKAGAFLDSALTRLGLNVRERCDMITYWLPQLEAYPFNAIFFVDVQRYAQAAKLTIAPAPDVLIRVFMAFRGLATYDDSLDTAKLEDLQAPSRQGFVAVEWGGMNLNGIV